MYKVWILLLVTCVYERRANAASANLYSYSVGNEKETTETNDVEAAIHLIDEFVPLGQSLPEEVSNTINKPHSPPYTIDEIELGEGNDVEIDIHPLDELTPIISSMSEEASNTIGKPQSNESVQWEESEESGDGEGTVEESDSESSEMTNEETVESEESVNDESSDESSAEGFGSGSGSGAGASSSEELVDLESGEDSEDFSGSGNGMGQSTPGVSLSSEFSFATSSEESEESSLFAPLKVMCTHTSPDDRFPWWQVDLGESKKVAVVNIFNRAQGFNDRLHDIYIGVGNKMMSRKGVNAQKISETCQYISNELPPGLTKITCEKPIEGRYVIIQLRRQEFGNTLTFCEVEVFGVETYHNDTLIPSEENIALKKPATQSSTSWGGEAANAVDGTIAAQYFAGRQRMSCLMNFDLDSRIINKGDIINGILHQNCAELQTAGYSRNGIYYVAPEIPNQDRRAFQVHCDMETAGGGWTVILSRHYYIGHHETFYNKIPYQYAEGFGDLCLEHWLGTDQLQLLTAEPNTLRTEIVDSYNFVNYVEIYASFKVDDNATIHTNGFQVLNFEQEHYVEDTSGKADCLVSGTPYTVQPGRGGWWWTPEQLAQNNMGPNGKLWIGKPEPNPIKWCNYFERFSNSRENFYIQFLEMKIRPASYKKPTFPSYRPG